MSNVTAVPIRPIKRSVVVWIAVGVALAIAAGTWLAWRGTGQVVAERGTNEQFLAWNATRPGVVETKSGLQYEVLQPGTGASPTDTDVALVEYSGALRDGSMFDKSERPTPMPVAGVVPGFSEGLKLMQKGGKYRLWLKPSLGYGDRSPDPKLPANSVLVFDVTLLEFLPQQVIQQMQMQQMMRQQQQGGGTGAPPPGMGQPQ